jgi:U3 small nucleolar RNA-associated protein MPP10
LQDDPVRQLAKAQFSALCAQLDQLAHAHYRPVPLIEEVTLKVDVPALMMEEAAPAFVSTASMRAPEEVYRRGGLLTNTTTANDAAAGEEGAAAAAGPGMLQPGGVFKTEAELTKEDRRRRRATKKRVAKRKTADRDAERAERAAATGAPIPLSGRKSDEAEAALRKMSKRAGKGAGPVEKGGRSGFTKSAKVFANLQAEWEGGGKGAAEVVAPHGRSAKQLKL